MAKVCSKSRLFHQDYQQRNHQRLSPLANTFGNPYPTAPGLFSQANSNNQPILSAIQQSPRFGHVSGNEDFLASATVMNNQHLSINSNTIAHLQAPHQFGVTNFGTSQVNYQNQGQNQQTIQNSNFDREKPSTIVNFITSNQQSNINLPQQNGKNLHSTSSSNGSSSQTSNSNNFQQEFGKFLRNNRAHPNGQQSNQCHTPMGRSTATNFSPSKPPFSEL